MKVCKVDARGFSETGYVATYRRDMTEVEIAQREADAAEHAVAAAARETAQAAKDEAAKKQAAREAFIDDLMAAEASK